MLDRAFCKVLKEERMFLKWKSLVVCFQCDYRCDMVIFKCAMYMPMLNHLAYVLEGVACMPSLTFSSFGSSFLFFFFFSWICMAFGSFLDY